MNLTKRRWLVLVASCFVNLCIGSMYSWSVFSGPMAEHLNVLQGTALTAADLAIVFSIGNGDGFISMILGGFLNDKLGTKWVVFLGTLLFGLGFVICGFATNVGMLILGYGILGGLSMGLAYGCTISNSVKFFPDKKGLVGGITTAAYGISSVVVPPIANALNNSVGVCYSFMIFGILTVVVGGLCSLLIVRCPDGFSPEGWTPVVKKSGGEQKVEDKNWKQMLTSPIFYVMIIMLFFGANFGMMVISQASNIAQSMIGMSVTSAATVVSALALFNTAGRVACGWISDKIGRVNTLAGVYLVAILALNLLILSSINQNVALFYIGICLIGVCFGAFMGVYPGFTNDQFGIKNSSVNYGIMFIGFNAAGILGPIIMRAFYNNTGSYVMAFVVAIIMAICGLLLSFLYRALNKNR